MSLFRLDSLLIAATIFLTAYGQIILKWRIKQWGPLPETFGMKVFFLTSTLIDPFILSGFVAAFGAALLWMFVMTKFDLAQVYPLMALNFPLTLWLSHLFLGETFSLQSALGSIIIVLGTAITAKRLL